MEAATAEVLPVYVVARGRTFVWAPETGLDPAVVSTVEQYIWKRAKALRYPAAMAGITVDDLVQEGRLGALCAARKFLPGKDASFLTYASFWIRRQQNAALSQGDVSIPERQRRALRHGGELPDVGSADSPADGGGTLADQLPSDEVAGQEAERGLQRRLVVEALGRLPERDRQILVQRFGLQGEAKTLAVLAGQFGLSGERIRQMEHRAILRLRRILALRGVSR